MRIAVIAPNISENMSGEAIKAYQYINYLTETGHDVTVITHGRSRGQFETITSKATVHVIEDDVMQKAIWNTVVFRPVVELPFFRNVRRLARDLAEKTPDMIFHYLCPVSPILPRLPNPKLKNVLGPLTGNIYYPPALSKREPFNLRWRRLSHAPSQALLRQISREKKHFNRILVSGGERTAASLIAAGAKADQLRHVIDSGISTKILERPCIAHEGTNYRFVCNGRMDYHKGIDLAVRAIAKTEKPVRLDIFGKGPMEETIRTLIGELNLQERVRLRGWLPSHDDLLQEMMSYRGFVFPSMAEANGIVVQEALAMGLPPICLNWGGPSVLTTTQTARQIEPTSEDHIVSALAREMDVLSEAPELANGMARVGYEKARHNFSWQAVAQQWIDAFSDV